MNTVANRAALRAAQRRAVAKLNAELASLIAEGNEYYAAMVREDIVAATSLARLVHRAA